jgi:hypothetical protein
LIDDKDSISDLTETTARCFDHEKVRLLYISAQVTRIDLKVDLAIAETMRIYKHTVRSALASGFIPGGPSATRLTVATVVCKTIVACFGVPTVSSKTVMEIVRSIIWEDIGHNMSVFFAEGVSTAGLFLTVGSGGILAPLLAASGVINAPIVVPAITRMFLMLACDVILILVRAFKDSTTKCIGQPLKKDIEVAAHMYRQISKKVHKKINKAVPRHNMIRSFQTNRVRQHFEEVVGKYKELVTADIGYGAILKVLDAEDDDSDSEKTLYEPEKNASSASIKVV